MMENYPITLVSDEAGDLFALYKCVNMVSTYNSVILDGDKDGEKIASGHLRCDQTRFVENMTKHIYRSNNYIPMLTKSQNILYCI